MYLSHLFYIGKHLCRAGWMSMHEIGERRLTRLLKNFSSNGPCTRDFFYKGTNRKSVQIEEVRRMLKFLTNISETFALDLPGRVPG